MNCDDTEITQVVRLGERVVHMDTENAPKPRPIKMAVRTEEQTKDRRISIRGQIEAKKFCAAGSTPSRQGVVTILATKPNASSFPVIVLLLCNFTDEDKKPEIVLTLFGVLQGVDNRPTDQQSHATYTARGASCAT